jgi:hypothetical protein
MILQLEVGRTYRNREGEKVKIVSMRAATAYRYVASDNLNFTEDGRFNLDEPEHDFDLLEECEPDEVVAEAPKPMPLYEAIVAEIDDICIVPGGEVWILSRAKEILAKNFAALSVEEIHKVIAGENACSCPSCTGTAQAIMQLLRKETP